MGSKDKKQEKNQNIHVAVRCRPLSLQEKKQGSHSIASINNEKREVYMKERANTKTFTFDQVFGPEAEQVDIYKSVVMPVVEEVLMGYNCTLFAYGQTGSGKTYTMEGERTAEQHISWDKDPLAGIIPRSVHQIFDTLTKQDVEFSMRVSFLELYNEELFDLLSSSDNGLRMRIFEDSAKKGSVVIQGLEEIAVMNKDEVYNIMERGAMKRQTAATLMNACSSRSHSVFSITIHIKENTVDGEELLKTGKLNLVDLAGSENIGRSGAIDKRAREAGNINQSLLSLGRVITALVERAPHVPYRESKLTRLLQDSLGGRTKTSIIATISPASFNLDETLSTLDYAHRAKNIQNRPEINQKLTKRTLIKEYTEEIEKLRKDLIAAREKNGIYLAEENYIDITSKLETQAAVIKELEDNIGALTDEITKVSEIFTETQSKLDETTKTLDYTTDQLCSTQHELHTTKRDRDEQKHLVGHHVRSERALYSQAKKLLTTSDESTADVSGLHSKLDRKHKVERHNLDTQTNFQTRFSDDITNMAARLSSFAQQQREMSHAVQENIGQTLTAHKERLEVFVQYLGKLSCSVEEGHDNLTTLRMDQLASNTAWTEEKLSYVRDTCRDASKSVSQRCHEQLQPNLCNIEQQLAQLKQHIADLSGYVKQQATTQQEMVQDFVKGQMAGLESIVVSVSAYAKDRETSVNALEQKVEEMTKANDSLQPIASLLMKTINEQSQTYKQVGEELAESSRVDSEFFNVRWPTYTQQCHATEVQFSESYASALKTAAEGVGEKIEMMKSAEQIAETKSSEGQECVSALEHDSTQRWTDMNTSLTSSVDALKKDLNAQTNKLNGCSEASVKEVARGKERLEGALTQHLSEHCQQVAAQMQNEVSLQVALLDQTESNVQQELEMRKEQLDTFLADELKVDIPTGTTPQRRDFAYPRTLSRTQPHDQLLQTYRASVDVSDAMNVSQARVLPLPEDTFVEEEDQENVNQQSLDKTGNSSNLDVSDNILACKSHHTNAARTSKLPLRNNN